jgi:ribosomal protein L7/L12
VANEREIWERFGEVERKLKKLYEHLGLEMPEEPEAGEVSEEVAELIRGEKFAEAVKLHREQSGAGLAEANQTVEGLRGKL